MESSIISEKSKTFAIRIINLNKYLRTEHKEFVLSNQILKSGTSIGANVREARRGQSSADFISKLSISLKEADETQYWLELLYETNYISDKEFISLNKDCEELIKILVSIIKTTANQ
ncbi:MAG: four helix bundle protein [Clostridia bacterium]